MRVVSVLVPIVHWWHISTAQGGSPGQRPHCGLQGPVSWNIQPYLHEEEEGRQVNQKFPFKPESRAKANKHCKVLVSCSDRLSWNLITEYDTRRRPLLHARSLGLTQTSATRLVGWFSVFDWSFKAATAAVPLSNWVRPLHMSQLCRGCSQMWNETRHGLVLVARLPPHAMTRLLLLKI